MHGRCKEFAKPTMEHNGSNVLLRKKKIWQMTNLKRTKQLRAQHTFSFLQLCWLKRLREDLRKSRGGVGEGARRREREGGGREMQNPQEISKQWS